MSVNGNAPRAGDAAGSHSSKAPEGAELRVIITHDFMETYGGAERVTQEMARIFPSAPVVAILGRASVARRMGVEDRFHTLLPGPEWLLRHYRLLAPFFPALIDHHRLPAADVVLSSSYAFAHRLRTVNDAPRVCYAHSPLRFAWSMTPSYQRRWAPGRLRSQAFELFARAMRRSDQRSSKGPAAYITQSPYTAELIKRHYDRGAEIIGAPVDTDLFNVAGEPPEDYYLLAGRLIEPYKQVAIVVDAFRRLPQHRLVVAGDGPALPALRGQAPPNVEFVGHLEDAALVQAMQRCRAAIFPSRDDFGLVPLEVMACGRPILAYGGGGALHTVRPGVTGELFCEQTADGVEHAIRSFVPEAYRTEAIRAHAESFGQGQFRARIREAVERAARAPV